MPAQVWLDRRGLGKYARAIKHLGARRVADLAHLISEDLVAMGMSADEMRDVRVFVSPH